MLTALIDGDVLLYKTAAVCEVDTDWGGGFHTLHSDAETAIPVLDGMIDSMIEAVQANDNRVVITDSGNQFRKTVYPLYKSNRKSIRRPLLWGVLREHLVSSWKAMMKPGLEGDDVLGILSTHPTIIKGDSVIVSIDKDMGTIPGAWFNPGKPEAGIMSVSEEEADYFHLFQTLTGDTTDGYPGCPGIGPVAATKLLDASPTWATVVEAYAKRGLTEADALAQARCARILRASDYDFKKKEPILWTPKTP